MANGKVGRKGAAKAKRARAGSDRSAGKARLRDELIHAISSEPEIKPGLGTITAREKRAIKASNYLADPVTAAQISLHENPDLAGLQGVDSKLIVLGAHEPQGSTVNGDDSTTNGFSKVSTKRRAGDDGPILGKSRKTEADRADIQRRQRLTVPVAEM